MNNSDIKMNLDPLIYFISNIMVAIIPLIMLPILTRVLSVEEFGQVALFTTFNSVFVSLFGFGFIHSLTQKYFAHGHSEEEYRCVISAGIVVFLANFIVVLCLGSCYLYLATDYDESFWVIFYTSCITAFVTNVINIRLNQWQIRRYAFRYGVLQVFLSLLNLTLTIVFVIIFLWGAKGRMISIMGAAIIIAFISIIYLRKDKLLTFRVSLVRVKEVYKYGFPLLPHFLAIFLISAADKFVINSKLGIQELGIYAVSFQLASCLLLFYDSANKYLLPKLYSELSQNRNRSMVRDLYIYFMMIFFVSIVVITIGPNLILLLTSATYLKGIDVFSILVVVHALGAMEQVFLNIILYNKLTKYVSAITIISGVFNLIGLIVLTDSYGITGAAFALLITQIIKLTLTFFIANKFTPLPWFSIFKN
jgi:O-antigen/teichoic acid export membrane protein